METGRENAAAISKLKIAVNQTDALASRLFYERLLGAADFRPPGISPKAIVCIKKIDAPPVYSNFFIDAAVWEKGVRAAIEKRLRHAFRPSRETVPARAECVIFEDKAEMLACLARDWTRGFWTERWWWRAVFPGLFRGQTAAQIWLDAAEFVPAALQVLSKNSAAAAFVEKLQPPEVTELLEKLTTVFGLEKLNAAMFSPFGKSFEFNDPEGQKSAEKENAKEISAANEFEILIAARLAGVNVKNLSFERQCLLETALLLARSARVVRSPQFAERVKNRRLKFELRKFAAKAGKNIAAAVSEEKPPPEKRVTAKPKFAGKSKTETPKESAHDVKNETKILRPQKDAAKELKISSIDFAENRRSADPLPIAETTLDSAVKSSKIEFQTVSPAKRPGKIELKSARKSARIVKPRIGESAARERIFEEFFEDRENDVEYSFATRFGGIFYLLNLGLFLGLYRDFTESLEAEIDLNIWDFTALLGLELIGDSIKSDAVWDFLKRAAEREGDDDFGREFDQFQDWRIDPFWLETFPKNQKWLFAARSNRLVVRHPAGFNALDVATRGTAATRRIARETQKYREFCAEFTEAGIGRAKKLKPKSWLENLAEYLQKRLFQALGVRNLKNLRAVLFARRANVSVTPTHLEITFNLADLPIEIRLAGIDRDPGWIPAAGKYVYFHFV